MNNIQGFHKKYTDKECLILCCGPSLTEYTQKQIESFAKDKIVICIKEAVLKYHNICDFFVFNRFRVRNFEVNDKNIFSIFQGDHNDNTGGNKIDLRIPYDSDFKKKCLLVNKDFELNNFKNKLSRTWGPGILLETVFYFCLYCGIKKCYTLGWDLSDLKKIETIEHFFDYSNDQLYSNSESLLDRNYENEMKLQHENIIHAYNYFLSKGMEIFVCGDMSFITKKIPRITL